MMSAARATASCGTSDAAYAAVVAWANWMRARRLSSAPPSPPPLRLPPSRMCEPAQRVVEGCANIAVPAASRDQRAGSVAIVVARVARMIASPRRHFPREIADGARFRCRRLLLICEQDGGTTEKPGKRATSRLTLSLSPVIMPSAEPWPYPCCPCCPWLDRIVSVADTLRSSQSRGACYDRPSG